MTLFSNHLDLRDMLDIDYNNRFDIPTSFSLWVVYQPIKSVISEKFALEAFLFPVLFYTNPM